MACRSVGGEVFTAEPEESCVVRVAGRNDRVEVVLGGMFGSRAPVPGGAVIGVFTARDLVRTPRESSDGLCGVAAREGI